MTPAQFRDLWLRGQELMQRAADSDGLLPRRSPLAPGHEMEPGREVWWQYRTKGRLDRVELLIEPGDYLRQLSLEQALSPPRPRAEPRTEPEPGHRTESEPRPERGTERAERADGPRSEDATAVDTHLLEVSRYAVDGTTCALALTFEEFLATVVPLSHFGPLLAWAAGRTPDTLETYLRGGEPRASRTRTTWAARRWFLELLVEVAGIAQPQRAISIARQLHDLLPTHPGTSPAALAHISLNRRVLLSVTRSSRTVKADAAARLFDIRCNEIAWAVVDTGIDARHHQFRSPSTQVAPGIRPSDPRESRIVQTLDFTKLRDEKNRSAIRKVRPQRAGTGGEDDEPTPRRSRDNDLPVGVPVSPALEFYEPPAHPHGTHVAGIIGGLDGLCPDIKLYDYRVMGEEGTGREFSVIAALRDILERNRRFAEASRGRSRDLLIHGVNLSLSLDGDVPSDACGWSLICRYCDELVRSGVVVVAAAGNSGYAPTPEWQELSYGYTYRTVSISDPGNTERVITVGSTHPERPLEYGISYFSARGPTADGRHKPDLVAPGEAIESALGFRNAIDDVWAGTAVDTGTSQAAAHVSACAAMLLARNRELIGKPDEVKSILCRTATDLGRERNFQGSGLVDALRALQEI